MKEELTLRVDGLHHQQAALEIECNNTASTAVTAHEQLKAIQSKTSAVLTELTETKSTIESVTAEVRERKTCVETVLADKKQQLTKERSLRALAVVELSEAESDREIKTAELAVIKQVCMFQCRRVAG